MNDLLKAKIISEIKRHPEKTDAYDDLFSYIRNIEEEDFIQAHTLNKDLRRMVAESISKKIDIINFFEIYKKTLLFDAPHYLDEYLLYLEINREPKDRFYQPRRRVLRGCVQALQDLADDKLDELFISMPPRVGKTSLLMFLTTWLIGRDPEKSNLYCAFSDTITKAFYNGVLEILQDPVTYTWGDVFPEAKIAQTNAAEETININRKRRYPSITARSLYGTLNGAVDCSGFLISDDLIGGIEEVLNKDRMIATWGKVDNNMLTRAKAMAKLLWVGTRWSMIDPAGLRMELLQNDKRFEGRRFKVINLPALDENDESNFDYDYGVGFSTQYFRERRASFERNNDMASWNAQYMGEPIEREGTLFTPDECRFYNGELPGIPDRIFMAVDPAFGGGDFVAAPICFQFGDDIYVHDVVYDNGDKKITQPLLAQAIEKYGVTTCQIEANKSTEAYAEGVIEELKKKNIRINITTKSASTIKAKEQRIFDKAPDIREFMIFREDGCRSKPYSLFMQNVYSFKMFAKNKHDDAPDSLAMAMDMVRHKSPQIQIFRRTF